eukprot:g1520.t1
MQIIEVANPSSCENAENIETLKKHYEQVNELMNEIGLDAKEKLQTFNNRFNDDDKNHECVKSCKLSSETGATFVLRKQDTMTRKRISRNWVNLPPSRKSNSRKTEADFSTTHIVNAISDGKNLNCKFVITGKTGGKIQSDNTIVILDVHNKNMLQYNMPTEFEKLIEDVTTLLSNGHILFKSWLRSKTSGIATPSALHNIESSMDVGNNQKALQRLQQFGRDEIDHVQQVSTITLHLQFALDALIEKPHSIPDLFECFFDAAAAESETKYQERCPSRQNQSRAGIQTPVILGETFTDAKKGFTNESTYGATYWQVTLETSMHENIVNVDRLSMCNVFHEEYKRFLKLAGNESKSEFLKSFYGLRAKLLKEAIYRMGNSGAKDTCAAAELLAMLCCDEKVKSCRGLKAIIGDYGLHILLEIIITGNECANIAARALSNTLATSSGPESASRIMESGGLGKVCQYLKTCKLGETEPLVIFAETLKVVKRCCERFRPDAQDLSIEEGIFEYLIDWVCLTKEMQLEQDESPSDHIENMRVESAKTLYFLTLDNAEIQMLHTEDIIKRAIDAYVSSIDKYPTLLEELCRWFGAIVSKIYIDQQIVFTRLNGFDDVLIDSIYHGHPKLRGRALLALSELVDANDKVKDRINEDGGSNSNEIISDFRAIDIESGLRSNGSSGENLDNDKQRREMRSLISEFKMAIQHLSPKVRQYTYIYFGVMHLILLILLFGSSSSGRETSNHVEMQHMK